MQGLWWKIKAAMQRFMTGRHGADQLTIALIYTALVVNLIALVPVLRGLSMLSMIMLLYAIFRTLSKNNARRYQENAWYVKRFGGMPGKVKQFFVRLKNSKKYVYFDCPECHAKLRLPRGAGEVTVTCGKCGHALRKKA
ncbi:MAG: hypothetical protein RSA12_10720 [Clostridia bacterium]